ncbi:twin-arginine translocase TatA/TatE family subunit [uncultured Nocardioides sp.]|uniref:Sec-independent protein translocase subunit TatA/TatB n=1 Tax=uncultured Nocardioides sp. TaxID=198441 RepID=UPI002621A011|nr:twin-arginine translocase TatA/TatE family subunit [uncultured Nocardioides sp.]
MFGLTFEKLFLVVLLAGFLLGPHRLPAYARELGRTVRSFRDLVEAQRARAESGTGADVLRREWQDFDPRAYDPRRVVRDALADRPAPAAYADPHPPEVHAQAATVRPGQTHLVVGDAAHPRRVRLDTLAADDPRRLAATLGDSGSLPSPPGPSPVVP